MASTAEQVESPLARIPYDLRHACLSGWLAAGVEPAQAAERAGHSLAILMHTYAKVIDGRRSTARRKIANALAFSSDGSGAAGSVVASGRTRRRHSSGRTSERT